MSIENYLNQIPSQHRDKRKFIAVLSIWLEYLQDIENLLIELSMAHDIDTAIGAQLDTVGVILGQSRLVLLNGENVTLSDTDYRLTLKAKIFKNQWKGKTDEIYEAWSRLFPLNPIIFIDNQDMTVDVIPIGFSEGVQQHLVENGYIIPKPQAVGINYYTAVLPIFAYDLDNETFAGYGTGNWLEKVTGDS